MSTRRKVLIVDPDPAAVRSAAVALRRRGFEVHAARDGSRALHLAILRAPDAVLVAHDAPLVDAETLVRILRANPRTAGVPVLLTGDASASPAGEEYVRKPFDADELATRVHLALRRSEAGRAASAGAGLRGDVREIPVPDLLQMLSTNRRTGRLVVEDERGRAEVVLEEGRVRDAANGSCVGEKALLRLLVASRGRFSFQPGPPSGPARVAKPLEELLLEGARHADEVARLVPALPTTDAVVAQPPGRRGAAPATPAAAEVLALLARPRAVRELLDGAAATDLDVLRALEALLRAGDVVVAGPPPVPGGGASAVVSPGAVHALRTRLRPGSAAGAIAAGKVLLAGGGPLARRTALARLASLPTFVPSAGGATAAFGTVGRLALAPDLGVDLVALPGDPLLAPLWSPFAAQALGVLVLLPADGLAPRLAALSATHELVFGICGPSADALDGELRPVAEGWPFLGPDPALALRGVLDRAAARERAPA